MDGRFSGGGPFEGGGWAPGGQWERGGYAALSTGGDAEGWGVNVVGSMWPLPPAPYLGLPADDLQPMRYCIDTLKQ